MMKKYLLLFLALTVFTFTSCSNEDNEGNENEGDGKTQVIITLKTLDGKVKEGYYVFVFEKLEDIQNNNLGKAVKEVKSDSKGQVAFDFEKEVRTSKMYYFEAYENTGKDMYPRKSTENTKIEVKKGLTKRVEIKVK